MPGSNFFAVRNSQQRSQAYGRAHAQSQLAGQNNASAYMGSMRPSAPN